jgi:hypothetical protein
MLTGDDILQFILEELDEELGRPGAARPDSVLLGSGAALGSLALVGLLTRIEDFCLENGLEFCWADDVAMSEKRSNYRTPADMAAYIAGPAGERGGCGEVAPGTAGELRECGYKRPETAGERGGRDEVAPGTAGEAR